MHRQPQEIGEECHVQGFCSAGCQHHMRIVVRRRAPACLRARSEICKQKVRLAWVILIYCKTLQKGAHQSAHY